MFSFFNPFKYWIIGIALVGLIGTFTYLNIRVNVLKKENATQKNLVASLTIANENWVNNYDTLQKTYLEQGSKLDSVIKDSDSRKSAADIAIKKAQLIAQASLTKYNAAKALSVQAEGKSCDEFNSSINKIIDEGH